MLGTASSDGRHWYVARVRSCQEKKLAESLNAGGVEHYLPVRREIHRWSDRRKLVEVLVLPRFIFVRCTPAERLQLLESEPNMVSFLSQEGKPAVVRDAEMATFRRMVEEGGGAVNLVQGHLAPGDRVRVVEGPLAGMECELVSVASGRCLAVRLGLLGTATMDIPIQSVVKI